MEKVKVTTYMKVKQIAQEDEHRKRYTVKCIHLYLILAVSGKLMKQN